MFTPSPKWGSLMKKNHNACWKSDLNISYFQSWSAETHSKNVCMLFGNHFDVDVLLYLFFSVRFEDFMKAPKKLLLCL